MATQDESARAGDRDRDLHRPAPPVGALTGGSKGRSNFVAFLLAAIMVASGLLAYVYYDSDGLDRHETLPPAALSQTMPARP